MGRNHDGTGDEGDPAASGLGALENGVSRLRALVGEVSAPITGAVGDGWMAEGDGDAVLALTAELAQVRDELDAVVASALAAVDRGGVAQECSGLHAKAWLAHSCGLSRMSSGRALAGGRVLRDFPCLAAAQAGGVVSMDHVQVLAGVLNGRIRAVLQSADAELVELARGSTPEQFRRDLQQLARLADQDGPEPDCRDIDTLSVATGAHGEIRLRGTFSGDHALVVADVLQRELTNQLRVAAIDSEHGVAHCPAATLRARALVELLRRATANPGEGRAPQTEAVVIVEPPTAETGCGPKVTTLDGEPVDALTAALLACTASLQPLQVDDEGRPLRYGRTRRLASLAQRRALAVRDGGCVFPGCDAPPSWCDAHHVPHWNGPHGRTDIDTMVLLCRRHHGLAHGQGWSLRPCTHGGPQRFEWTNHRLGVTTPAQRRHHTRSGQSPPRE